MSIGSRGWLKPALPSPLGAPRLQSTSGQVTQQTCGAFRRPDPQSRIASELAMLKEISCPTASLINLPTLLLLDWYGRERTRHQSEPLQSAPLQHVVHGRRDGHSLPKEFSINSDGRLFMSECTASAANA